MKRLRVRSLVVATVVVSALLLGGAYSVFAATTQSGQYPPIVEKLAKAFNLDPAKVDKVFQDDRAEREAYAKARFEDRLDQAVTDGKITAAQKTAILKKMDELKTKHEELRNLAPEDRRAAMEKLRTEMQAWAKENGLDQKQYMLGPGMFMGGRGGFGHGPRGFGGPRGFVPAPDTSTGTSSGVSAGTGSI